MLYIKYEKEKSKKLKSLVIKTLLISKDIARAGKHGAESSG